MKTTSDLAAFTILVVLVLAALGLCVALHWAFARLLGLCLSLRAECKPAEPPPSHMEEPLTDARIDELNRIEDAISHPDTLAAQAQFTRTARRLVPVEEFNRMPHGL